MYWTLIVAEVTADTRQDVSFSTRLSGSVDPENRLPNALSSREGHGITVPAAEQVESWG